MRCIDLLLLIIIANTATPAAAYVGPGPGLSMVGSFFTLLAGVFLALFLVLLYPIRLFLKRRKQKKSAAALDQTSD